MLTTRQKNILKYVADRLNVHHEWLFNLIRFESNFNPKAQNPYSTAKGLIQFTDSTAKRLGYASSRDLINKHNTIESQLMVPVYRYLKQFAPFPTKQSLYMSVFYPAYRNVSQYKIFPLNVRKVNPGINKPLDYINKVERKNLSNVIPLLILLGIGYLLYSQSKTKNKGGNNASEQKKGTFIDDTEE